MDIELSNFIEIPSLHKDFGEQTGTRDGELPGKTAGAEAGRKAARGESVPAPDPSAGFQSILPSDDANIRSYKEAYNKAYETSYNKAYKAAYDAAYAANYNTDESKWQRLINKDTPSLHYLFAKIQMDASTAKKAEADALIKEIQDENAIIAEARKYLASARSGLGSCPEGGWNGFGWGFKEFFQANGIPLSMPKNYSNGNEQSKETWEINIKQLENFIESKGMNTQTKMVQLEDLMGKYNSWSQGASQAINDGNQLTHSLWKI